jgi:hypothetical protein
MPTKKIKSLHKKASSGHAAKGKGLGDPTHSIKSFKKSRPRKATRRIGSAVG